MFALKCAIIRKTHKGAQKMPVSEAKRAAITRYNEKCGRIELRPLKEDAEKIKAAAAAAGQSTQGYILQACAERMQRDKTK